MRTEGYQYQAFLAQQQEDNDEPYQRLSQNRKILHQLGNKYVRGKNQTIGDGRFT